MNRSKVKVPASCRVPSWRHRARPRKTPNAKGPNVKTENGRGRGGDGWAMVKEIIELARTEVISMPPEQRKRVLERARKELAVWRRSPQASEAAAKQRAARRARAPRIGRPRSATKSERGYLTG